MKTTILGSGNVAFHLSKALIKAGHPIKQVWSRNPEKAIDFALEIGANSITAIKDIHAEIELIIIAVSDDAIASIVKEIPTHNHQLILHTSGSTSINILNKFEHYGVLYPLQTFSKNSDLDFNTVPLFVEANNTRSEIQLTQLAQQLSAQVTSVDSQKRMQMHIAAVFACNFSNALYAMAQQILSTKGLSFDLLRPLIQETNDKVMLQLPSQVQTGPAKRNDQSIINKHLNALAQDEDLRDLYQKISQYIVKNNS